MEAKIKSFFALTLAAGLGLGASAAAAAPSNTNAPDLNAGIILVEGGCGPYGHRGPDGYCHPNRPPPPEYYRRCPPYFHPTPYGCRPD
jgi:hypothetical protein